MRQDVGTELPLFSLDELDVCLHAVLFEVLSEQIRNVGIRVQTRELSSARISSLRQRQTHSDELENEAQLAQIPNILLDFLLSHSRFFPIETG